MTEAAADGVLQELARRIREVEEDRDFYSLVGPTPMASLSQIHCAI
jgi:hypothetical protein